MSSANDTPDNRFAPPRAVVADVADVPEGAFVLADRGQRLGAAVIDFVLVMAALWVVSRITPWNPFDTRNGNLMDFHLTNTLFGFAVFVLVQGYPLATASQTWGKKMLGVRIVRGDGAAVEFGRLLGLRYALPRLFGVVPVVGIIWGLIDSPFIFRQSRRCLHDSIADTIVIKL